jgi:hypothetical protein
MYRNTVLPEYVFKAYVGDYVDLKKMREVFERASVESTFAGFMNAKREAEFEKLLKKIKQNSVDIEVEVAKAVSKTLTLKTPRKDVVKSAENVRKLSVSELLPRIALHGGNMNVLLSWKTFRGLVNAES